MIYIDPYTPVPHETRCPSWWLMLTIILNWVIQQHTWLSRVALIVARLVKPLIFREVNMSAGCFALRPEKKRQG